jgi:hypothetical protein
VNEEIQGECASEEQHATEPHLVISHDTLSLVWHPAEGIKISAGSTFFSPSSQITKVTSRGMDTGVK